MTVYPLATLAAQITNTGISAPSYSDILASLQASYWNIYGSDAILTPDSQDGQMLAVFASAVNDCNQTAINVFNSFSPSYAQGAQLSSLVKINGLAREVPSYSTVAVTCIGQTGTIITNGVVQDVSQNLWNLPTSVVIPSSGSITVTATAQDQGAISIAALSINTASNAGAIYTPTLGWQSASNSSASVPGAAVEQDAALRQRQSVSTSVAAVTPLQSISGAIGDLSGVGRYLVYENSTTATDAHGIPAHNISAVVEGGNITTIAQTIEAVKSEGTGTYGSTSVTVLDPIGVPVVINFYALAETPIYASVTLTALTGYVSTTGTYIQEALALYIAGLGIGVNCYLGRLWGPANLSGTAAIAAVSAAMQASGVLPSGASVTQAQLDALSATYDVTAITIGTSLSSLAASDVAIAFNAAAQGSVSNISLTVH